MKIILPADDLYYGFITNRVNCNKGSYTFHGKLFYYKTNCIKLLFVKLNNKLKDICLCNISLKYIIYEYNSFKWYILLYLL